MYVTSCTASLIAGLESVRPMSHLRQSRARLRRTTLVASQSRKCDRACMSHVASRRLAQLRDSSSQERCPILCDFDARQCRASVARQNRRCDIGLTWRWRRTAEMRKYGIRCQNAASVLILDRRRFALCLYFTDHL